MNPSPVLSRPRFTCRFVRHWCAWTGAAAPRHAAGCAECRAYFAAAAALDDALRRDAAAARVAPDAALENRILAAVRVARNEELAGRAEEMERSSRRLVPLWTAGAAAAAVAVLAAILWTRSDENARPPRERPLALATPEEAAQMVRAVGDFSQQLVSSVLPRTGALVADNPLRREADSLYADARSAIGFLAMNFLPAPRENPRPPSG